MENDTNTPSGGKGPTELEIAEFYSEQLRFLWEQYLKVVHLVLTLSGGTILLLLNTLKIVHGKDMTQFQAIYSWTAIGCAVGALAGGIAWRSCAQIVMEAQIYGKAEYAKHYFTNQLGSKILPVALRCPKKLQRYEHAYDMIKWFVLALLVGSWIAIILFLASGGSPPVEPK